MKTIRSLIEECETRTNYWRDVAHDKQSLVDLDKTREQALCLQNYFEGKYDGLVDAKRLLR